MGRNIVGIDIGGTSIKLGLVSESGELLYKWSIPTNHKNGGFSIINDLWSSLQHAFSEYSFDKGSIMGIGAGIPGFINIESGIIYEAVNIGFKELQFKKELESVTGLPVYIENDANVAALGENWRGAGNNSKHIVAVTLGTGVGGGIISNGKILNGQNGMAGELGHIFVQENGVQCNCGNIGCLETIASATGIVRQAISRISGEPDSSLTALYEKESHITAEDVFNHAAKGDKIANEVIGHTTEILARTFANLGVILNPEKILIGGGVSKAGQLLLDQINASFQRVALPRVKKACEIKLAQLGNDAGVIGAAYLVKQNEEGISF